MSDKKDKINWKRTFKNNAYMLGLIAKSSPGVLVLTFIATVLGAINSFLVNTYLYQYALNALQKGTPLKTVFIVLACMLGYSLFYVVFRNVTNFYMELRRPRVERYVQSLVYKKAAQVDLECFENSAFYDTYVKAVGEATNRAYVVMNNLADVLWIVINVVAVGTLIATISPIFLAIALLPLICTLLVGRKRNRIGYEYSMRNAEAARQRDYVRRAFYLGEFSKEMRLTEMWKVMFARMRKSVREMKENVRKYGYKMMFFRYLFDLSFDIAVYSGSIIVASYKTLVSKTMLVGDCFVVINSIMNVANNINHVGNVIFKLDENSLYVENLRSFLEYEVKIAEDENAPAVEKFESLELRSVSFSYANASKPALSHVDMSIMAGDKIAIVGHNGAGKSTLVKLLQRLYDVSEGEILLNGENIKTYRLSSYRNLFGTVFQDYQLFATTVAENVMLKGGISDEDKQIAEDALKNAGIYDKIQTLPHGIDTTVTKEFDSEGAMFSGGEAQKISIARIFAGKHEIVIMDEPTSALDPIAENEMYRNMFEACRDKTVIFISHRLSSATMADRVYMFENGEIVEQGTHSELLALGAKYADMWHKQADTYAEEVQG